MDVNLSADEIEQIIPHRYPMLLVDRMVEIEDGARGVGIKSVTANEWFFEGHFPGNRVMPGVLIVEALAQVAAITLLRDVDQAGKIPMFGGIEKMRFRRPVTPGDQLRLSFTLERMRGPVGRGAVEASVDGQVVADGTISFALVENPTGQ
ncbi:MAG: 3-hydroxyacyl-ACP dehydratase FabZ [Dehalococcoidia bacterium]|nr:3-hydroxyacyl-ACP dehydratase FabZ [Chloroflexota bacterium]MXX19649.1 3-hydroxyacyl-ACP dehydratase FabZ [Dehalococcoidia bacterium]MDE2934849.1 3-hydroxyacyl-ACP dehydratase FabZ [Chloroflexota bacterium]MXY36150.1 3-hydroxyacyl-ACP dehydratase FabZ [Dehalococcoidia bacterium]MYD29722.1 3-hydroxyacyl-ACP dehydratase FabZ [Dehalococcoidia bacterium]